MNGDTRYSAPNAISYPAVTRVAILPYYKRLIARFGRLIDMPVNVQESRMALGRGDYTRNNRARARTCWASTRATTGHDKGWGRMIHDASHEVFEIRHPSARPHDGGHATLEREMAEYVARKLWTVPTIAVKPKSRPTYDERIAHTRALMARWETKAKRAATALRKLQRRVRALERAAKNVKSDTLVN